MTSSSDGIQVSSASHLIHCTALNLIKHPCSFASPRLQDQLFREGQRRTGAKAVSAARSHILNSGVCFPEGIAVRCGASAKFDDDASACGESLISFPFIWTRQYPRTGVVNLFNSVTAPHNVLCARRCKMAVCGACNLGLSRFTLGVGMLKSFI